MRRGVDHLPDIVREVESEIESFHAMLDASVIVGQPGDVRISEGDQFLLYMRNLPNKVQEFLQLHQNATTVNQIKIGVQDHYIRTRVQGDLGTLHVAQPVQKAADLKDKTCFNCGKKGHLAESCPEPKKCSHCGKKGHVAKDCWEKHPEQKPKPKPKSQSSNSKGKSGTDKKGQTGGRGRGRGGRKAKGRGRGNRFRTVDGEEEEYEEGEDDYEDGGEPEGAMDCFGTHFTHAQTCDYVRSATQRTASVHTSHMPKPVITFVFKVLHKGLLRYILHTCPNL